MLVGQKLNQKYMFRKFKRKDKMYHLPSSLFRIKLTPEYFLYKNLYSNKDAMIVDEQGDQFIRSFKSNLKQSYKKFKKKIEFLKKNHILLKENEEITLKFFKPSQAEVWLHLTNQCNLRCSYCYVVKNKLEIDLILVKKIIRKVFSDAKEYKIKKIRIKYSGGEPLLKFSKLLQIHKFTKKISSDCGIRYTPVLLTNGVLLNEEKIHILIKEKIKLMISLDGIGKYNSARRFENGKLTDKIVFKNIILCKKLDLIPDVSITVSSYNADGLIFLIKKLINLEIPFTLNFLRDPSWMKQNIDRKKLESYKKKLYGGLKKLYKFLKDVNLKISLLNSLSDRALPGLVRNTPCYARETYIVIDPKGKISRCQYLMYDYFNYNKGNIFKNIQNYRLDKNLSKNCQKCKWKYICAGGCPLLKDKTGKSRFCEIYKKILPEIFRIEGLRILRNIERLSAS